MQFLVKRVQSLKVDSPLGAIIGFAASKQPRNPKFTLNLKTRSLAAKALCNAFAFAKEPNNKGRCQPRSTNVIDKRKLYLL